jgi:hypothetical protein
VVARGPLARVPGRGRLPPNEVPLMLSTAATPGRSHAPDPGVLTQLFGHASIRPRTVTTAHRAGAEWAVACPVVVESAPLSPVGHDRGRCPRWPAREPVAPESTRPGRRKWCQAEGDPATSRGARAAPKGPS